jgi:hypothetical protein
VDVKTALLLEELRALMPALRQAPELVKAAQTAVSATSLPQPALADVAALIRILYRRVEAIEYRTGAREPLLVTDISVRFERLEKAASPPPVAQQPTPTGAIAAGDGIPAWPLKLLERIEALETAVAAIPLDAPNHIDTVDDDGAELPEGAATFASDAGKEQAPELAAILARLEALETAEHNRRRRSLTMRARNDERSTDALRRRRAINGSWIACSPPRLAVSHGDGRAPSARQGLTAR